MKMLKGLFFVAIVVSIVSWTNVKDATNAEGLSDEVREYYQFKTYIFDTEEQVIATDNFLKSAYLPALKRAGIVSVGVFKPIVKSEDDIKKIHLLIPFKMLGQFLLLEEILKNDSEYLSESSDYLAAAYNKPNYKRIESVILKAFVNFPKLKEPSFDSPRSERVYEMRSYESSSESYYKNKVDMFNEGGEIKLFDRLGFNAIFYGEVISGDKMPNLMYMTSFSTQDSRDVHWKSFFDSPEWGSLKVNPKYKNNVSHADKIFLFPTEYSDY